MKNYPTTKLDIEKVVREHKGLVRRVSHHIHGRMRSIVEIEDLLQVGLIGLIEAAQRYTRQEGVSFESYAVLRIRGAIYDYLRKNTNLGRKAILTSKAVKAALASLSQKLGREPTQPELAEALSMSLQELSKWAQNVNSSYHNSLQDEYDEHSLWFSSNEPTTEHLVDRGRLKDALLAALVSLPKREALVLQLYYVEELNLYEIAAVLEVTPGRVSQLKSAAFKKMQPSLVDFVGEMEAP
ncbi:RNA polymerase sigma factor for flagellar operon [Octadecabacter antarcticus 307]|uniref:RNA polymerase sigma factor for flagellar operon n=1 Tax=Octadecabacter antarcticus 307 TaxID=391626 RepID=M9RDQ5_9RHOB|nr:FliA/WhiG family RNA polymerase sigma factor [Octadecabacter antarcticus]AGI68516.1 RNA polymerase sigma factor for flagellar operon [Octadecabacter antarcticus 307]